MVTDTPNHPAQSEQEPTPENINFETLLRQVGMAYDKLEQGNKRMKLDMDEARAKDVDLRNSIGELFAEKVSLQAKLREEKTHSKKVCKGYLTLKRKLATAEKRAVEAEETAMKRYAKDRQQYVAQVREEKARADEAEKKLAGIRAYFGEQAK